MRNTLVPLVKSGLVCSVIIASAQIQTGNVTAQSVDPSTLPMLSSGGLEYLGAFRVPTETVNGTNFTSGGRSMAFNPATNSLYISGYGNAVAEVSIPPLVSSSDVNDLPYATLLQPFVDPMEGQIGAAAPGGGLTGLMVYGNRLYGTATIWYDANNTQRVSHFSRSLQLNQPSFSGWSPVWQADRSALVSGWMAPVPSEWQAKLGGPAVTGQCCVSIVWRTSNGPAAIAFNPAGVGTALVNATPLLYYTIVPGQDTLGPWEGQNATYGATTYIRGMAVIAGTRTALYFGNNGLGEYCYGNGTADRSLVGTVGADGGGFCYDPTEAGKGQHAYPYRYQVWAYDLNDLAAVKAGQKQPWEVRPYGVWTLPLPTSAPKIALGGVGYDAVRQIVYVAQLSADNNNRVIAEAPVIHAFRLSATPGVNASTNTVSAVGLTTDRPAPQLPGTPITFTAQPTGGVAPYQYKWIVSDGSTATVAATWNATNRFTWTPTAANANYQISVWVRSAGNTADVLEGSASLGFPVGAPTATALTTAVALTANRVAPQPPLTAITWTATPTGGVAPHQYKWRIWDGAAWTALANWSPTNTFVWTPSTTNPGYHVEVWVRSAGNTADAAEASRASAGFAIEGVATTPPSPPTVPSPPTPVSSVAISADKAEPQQTGTAITWTAAPSGGTAPFLYKWFVSADGANYTVVANWTSSASYVWSPTVANANYRIRVWVKVASNAADLPEASVDKGFSITAPPPTTTIPPPTTITPPPTTITPPPTTITPPPTTITPPPPVPTPPAAVGAVTLSSDKHSPVSAGATVVWTAQATGGVAPYQYQWWVYDGRNWNKVKDWSGSSTFSWTPATADSKYQVGVRARSSGSTNDSGEAIRNQPFVVNNGNGKK